MQQIIEAPDPCWYHRADHPCWRSQGRGNLAGERRFDMMTNLRGGQHIRFIFASSSYELQYAMHKIQCTISGKLLTHREIYLYRRLYSIEPRQISGEIPETIENRPRDTIKADFGSNV